MIRQLRSHLSVPSPNRTSRKYVIFLLQGRDLQDQKISYRRQNVKMLNVECSYWSMRLLQLASSLACHLNRKKETFQINIVDLRIPTGRRQTNWLKKTSPFTWLLSKPITNRSAMLSKVVSVE